MTRVVVLGSLNADLSLSVPNLPRPGETVLGRRLLIDAGGKGANQAAAAARLGAEVVMVGRVGRDAHGDQVLDKLAANRVDISNVERDEVEPTGVALILVDDRGQNVIAVAPGANHSVGDRDVARAGESLSSGDILVVQIEIPLDAVKRAVEAAVSRSSAVILNAAPATQLQGPWLEHVEVLVVNEIEAGMLVGVEIDGPAGAIAAAPRLSAMGFRNSVITLGANGAVVCHEGATTHVPGHPVQVLDATGAGDAFVGALAAAMAANANLDEAVRLANAAGAATVTAKGAQGTLPTLAQLREQFGIEWDPKRHRTTDERLHGMEVER